MMRAIKRHWFLSLFIGIITVEIVAIIWLVFNTAEPVVIALESGHYQKNSASVFANYYEPKPNTTVFTYGVENRMNREGFNDDEHDIQKPTDAFRIITLGDSHTFGFGVPRESAYPKQLEKILNASPFQCTKIIEVINLGVPGYDIAFATERFRLRGAAYNPDLVVWFISDDDLTQDADHNLQTAGKPALKRENISLIETLFGFGLDATVARQTRAMLDFKNTYEGPIAIINRSLSSLSRERLKNIHVPILISPEKPGNNLFAEDELLPDGHANEKGHAALAERLAIVLVEKRLVPCLR